MKDFLTWIDDNKDWIFDGIGVTIIVALVGIVKWIFYLKKSKKNNHTDSKQMVIKQDAYGTDETLIGIQNNYNVGKEEEKHE